MNDKDRQEITRNLNSLMQNIVLNDLIPHVKSDGLFPPSMMQEYMTESKPENERKKKLILDVRKRGPDAKIRFINCLISAKLYDAAKILKPDFIVPQDVTDSKGSNSVPTEHYSTPLEEIVVKKSISCHPESPQIYEIKSKPKGLALIIINKAFDDPNYYRQGANVDCDLWKQLFSQLDYKIVFYKDLNKENMEKALNDFAENPEHSQLHSCIVAISSHGIQNNIVCCDMKHYPVDDIFKKFNNSNCKALIGRPKMFFIQACRGEAFDDGVPLDHPDSIGGAGRGKIYNPTYVPTFTDMIIIYSTIEGYVSHRNERHGSWLIEIMCRVFMDNAWNTDLDTMLKIVQREMRKRRTADGEKQMCEIIFRGWDRDLYFNPGL